MFRTFTQELRPLTYSSNEYVIIYTTWSCVRGTSLYHQCSCLSYSHVSTNCPVPLRQVFSVQLVRCVFTPIQAELGTNPEPSLWWTKSLNHRATLRGGHCCLHFCSSSSCVNLIPHFSFMSGVMECFVLKSKQAKALEFLPENPQGSVDEFISGRDCDELLSKHQLYHSFLLQVIIRKRILLSCKEEKIRNTRNKLLCSPLILTLSYAVKHSTSPTTPMVPWLSISRCWWAHLKFLFGTLEYENHIILTAVPITRRKLHWLSLCNEVFVF